MDIVSNYPEGVMKLPVYDASALTKGQVLKWGAEGSGTGNKALIDVADTAADAFAILMETPSSVVTNLQTPVLYQAQVRILNNPSLLKIYYDMSTSNDLDVSSSTSTVITVAAVDDDMDGSWVYINSGTGAGQLRYVKAADTTTLTVNTAFTTTPDSTSDFILIRPVGIQASSTGLALDSTFSKIAPVLNETATSSIIPLKNFVQGPMGTKELDITANSDLETDGLDSRGVRFYSICILGDTALAAAGV